MNPYIQDDRNLDAADREADAMIATEEAARERADFMATCDGLIYEAVESQTAQGTESSESFWNELRLLMQHGTDSTDDAFLEAARGVYDMLDAMLYDQARQEVNGGR